MRRLQKLLPTHFAREFLALESAGGIVMIAAAVLAIALANSPLSELYHRSMDAVLVGHLSVASFTKDVFMAIFFLAVGMELKCEMREGALSAKGQKILPLIAAVGGIVLPALFYLGITHAHPEYRAGWAIPTATDIAFALCVLRLAGPAVPQAAKIFLLAIAIYDDLAAILIIAFFYASGLSFMPLFASAGIMLLMALLNHRHIDRAWPYLLLGVGLWFTIHAAGIHPTVAGVITGIAIPMRSRTTTPLLASLLHRLHPYVAFGILPLFALTSAGVDLRGIAVSDAFGALPLGVALALFFGKQLGIFGATWLCVKLRVAALPEGVNWHMVYAVAIIAGIGFTMSLFIGSLAFHSDSELNAVKLGVIGGSLLSAVWGLIYLRLRRMA
jgi:NhaA family Na+:H+ antiporter